MTILVFSSYKGRAWPRWKYKIRNAAKFEAVLSSLHVFTCGEAECMEVRGKRARVESLLPSCGFWRLNSGHRAEQLALYPSRAIRMAPNLKLCINLILGWRFHTRAICFLHKFYLKDCLLLISVRNMDYMWNNNVTFIFKLGPYYQYLSSYICKYSNLNYLIFKIFLSQAI